MFAAQNEPLSGADPCSTAYLPACLPVYMYMYQKPLQVMPCMHLVINIHTFMFQGRERGALRNKVEPIRTAAGKFADTKRKRFSDTRDEKQLV